MAFFLLFSFGLFLVENPYEHFPENCALTNPERFTSLERTFRERSGVGTLLLLFFFFFDLLFNRIERTVFVQIIDDNLYEYGIRNNVYKKRARKAPSQKMCT